MLPVATVPVSLLEVLGTCRGAFGAPAFVTFTLLVTGALAAVGPRTVTGMWTAAGMAAHAHWSRAHRFFSETRWDPDALGLLLARLVMQRFTTSGAALTVAVDDTLFHRYGRKVFGCFWQHDGSAKGRDGIGRGNCFVIVGLVVTVPFIDRSVCLPLLFRLHLPKTSASKTEQARAMVNLIARAFAHRRVHVVADALYRGKAWRGLPGNVTFTTRLASNAVLYAPAPPPTGKRGRPALKGKRLGNPGDLAEVAAWTRVTLTRYGERVSVDVAVVVCLWWGSLHTTAVHVVLLQESDSHKIYNLALVTTDLTATAAELVCRYADRWSIEQAIKDSKDHLGAGDAQNRGQKAVERTVPFAMLNLTILTLWYHHAGNATVDIAARRTIARWYRHKRHIAVTDMLTAFRRARITDITAAHDTPQQNPDEVLTWGSVAA